MIGRRQLPAPTREYGCRERLIWKDPDAGTATHWQVQAAMSVCFVEVKRKTEIGREVIDEMCEKVRRIRVPRGKAIKTALVYCGHLAPVVEAEGYFNAVVDVRDVLF